MSTGTGKAAPWFDRRSAEGTCPGTPTLYEGAAAVWGDASRASSVAAPLKITEILAHAARWGAVDDGIEIPTASSFARRLSAKCETPASHPRVLLASQSAKATWWRADRRRRGH